MQKKYWVSIGAAVLLVIAALAVWRLAIQPVPAYEIPMAQGEQVTTWDFKGAYTGNPGLEAKAQEEIERLTKLLGSGEHPDYTLYVSIANQYDLLGDGASELVYLEKALAIDATTTGLAWNNAGALFERLGVLATARMAYERAVAAQPIAQYRQTLADFLKKHYPEDTAAIKAALEAGAGTSELPQ